MSTTEVRMQSLLEGEGWNDLEMLEERKPKVSDQLLSALGWYFIIYTGVVIYHCFLLFNPYTLYFQNNVDDHFGCTFYIINFP